MQKNDEQDRSRPQGTPVDEDRDRVRDRKRRRSEERDEPPAKAPHWYGARRKDQPQSYAQFDKGQSFRAETWKDRCVPEENKVMRYTDEELRQRQGHHGSTRCLMDHIKFKKDCLDNPEFMRRLRLSEEHQAIWDANPHLRQVFIHRRQDFVKRGRMEQADRMVTAATPRRPYKRRQGEAKTVNHWGQRKLLFSEIEFLTLYGAPGDTVIYAGAAPGTHTNFLAAELFPELHFELIDPARFDAWETPKVVIRQEFFDDEMAKQYAARFEGKRGQVLFISDVRSMDDSMPEKQKEECVEQDMKGQMAWFRIIQPKAAMFKLRLPYPPPERTVQYLDGDIFLPIWGARTTTETRLVATGDTVREYNNRDYEELCFHFNTVTRTSYYDHDYTGKIEGIDHCFDCASELFVLEQYLRRVRNITEPAALQEAVVTLSTEISTKISRSGRTLAFPWGQTDSKIWESDFQ